VTTFPDTFRAIAVPTLRRACRFHALLVATRQEAFEEASAAVMQEAMKHGSLKLPPRLGARLEDWIDTALLRAIDSFEPAVREAEAAADRAARWVAQHEAAFVATLEPA